MQLMKDFLGYLAFILAFVGVMVALSRGWLGVFGDAAMKWAE